jgi:hypothetical protein
LRGAIFLGSDISRSLGSGGVSVNRLDGCRIARDIGGSTERSRKHRRFRDILMQRP